MSPLLVYVLNGTLRLVLGEHDLILNPGEAAEFDTRTPHWFGATSSGPVEYLSLIGKQGERAHVRAAPKLALPAGGAELGPGTRGWQTVVRAATATP